MNTIEQEEFKAGISQFITAWMVHLKNQGVPLDQAYQTPLSWVRSFCDSVEEQQEKENKERNI